MRTPGKSSGGISPPSRVAPDERRRHPNECPCCAGLGTTPDSRPVLERGPGGKTRTVSLGHGCLRCGGTGRVGVLTCSRVQ